MHNKKRIIAILIVMIISVLATGCEKGGKASGDTADKSSEKNEKTVDRTDEDERATGKENDKKGSWVGNRVSLKTIKRYMDSKDSYEIYAIKEKDRDEFTILSYETVEHEYADLRSEDDIVRLYAADRDFMLDVDREDLVVFTNGSIEDHFQIAEDLSYYLPLVFNCDQKLALVDDYDLNFRRLYEISCVSSNMELPAGEYFETEDLKVNGKIIAEEDRVFVKGGVKDGKETGWDWMLIHTGNESPVEVSAKLDGKQFEATFMPAHEFYEIGEIEDAVFEYTVSDDGYAVYDLNSCADGGIAGLLDECGEIDEEDYYSRLVIGDGAVLGFRSDNKESWVDRARENNKNDVEETDVETDTDTDTDTDTGKGSDQISITIEWDETGEGMCAPEVIIEAADNGMVSRNIESSGPHHHETIVIRDPDMSISIYVEPSEPTNDCPIDTVRASVIDRNGNVTVYTADDRMMRGQTGIWYFDVYSK